VPEWPLRYSVRNYKVQYSIDTYITVRLQKLGREVETLGGIRTYLWQLVLASVQPSSTSWNSNNTSGAVLAANPVFGQGQGRIRGHISIVAWRRKHQLGLSSLSRLEEKVGSALYQTPFFTDDGGYQHFFPENLFSSGFLLWLRVEIFVSSERENNFITTYITPTTTTTTLLLLKVVASSTNEYVRTILVQ
jgi:hypothetical protein